MRQGVISPDSLAPAAAPHVLGSGEVSSLGKWLMFLQTQKYVFDLSSWEEEDVHLENYLCC